MREIIAGHKFKQGPTGKLECVLYRQDTQGKPTHLCLKSWCSIRNSGTSDLGKPDIAHDGNLNGYELEQIQEARQDEDTRIAHAVHDAAFSGNRSASGDPHTA